MKRKLISIQKMKGDDNDEKEIYSCTDGMRDLCRKFLQENDQNNMKEELKSTKLDRAEVEENESSE